MSSRSDAFEGLLRAHYGRLCDFAHRYVRSRAVAEDIVQDVFVRVLGRDDFDYDDPLPYLYRSVRNGAVSHLRRQRTRDRHRARADQIRSVADTDAEVEYHELVAAVERAVDALPTRQRLIFTMSREQGLTYAEIARALGLSSKTVENQMGRALKRLRERLAPYLCLGASLLSTSRVADALFS